jgi:hypothetical protein
MTSMKHLTVLAGVVALAACTESRPPMAGANPGTAAPPLQQRSAEQPHSAPTSSGAEISGARGGGRPEVTYTTPGTGTVGGQPMPIPQRGRTN